MPAKLRRVLPHGVMLAASCWLYWATTLIEAETGGRIGPAVWPKAIIVFMGLLCLYEIVKRLVVKSEFEAKGLVAMGSDPNSSARTSSKPVSDTKLGPDPIATSPGRSDPISTSPMLYAGIALIAAYVVAVPWLGFFLATALFLATFPRVGGVRRPAACVSVSLVGTLVLALVFLKVAYISLPLGEGPFRTLSLGFMRLIGVT